jgi:hypothetical protein
VDGTIASDSKYSHAGSAMLEFRPNAISSPSLGSDSADKDCRLIYSNFAQSLSGTRIAFEAALAMSATRNADSG